MSRQKSVEEKPSVVMIGAPLAFFSTSLILIGVVPSNVRFAGGLSKKSVAVRGGDGWGEAASGKRSTPRVSAARASAWRLTAAPCYGSGPALRRWARGGRVGWRLSVA